MDYRELQRKLSRATRTKCPVCGSTSLIQNAQAFKCKKCGYANLDNKKLNERQERKRRNREDKDENQSKTN